MSTGPPPPVDSVSFSLPLAAGTSAYGSSRRVWPAPAGLLQAWGCTWTAQETDSEVNRFCKVPLVAYRAPQAEIDDTGRFEIAEKRIASVCYDTVVKMD